MKSRQNIKKALLWNAATAVTLLLIFYFVTFFIGWHNDPGRITQRINRQFLEDRSGLKNSLEAISKQHDKDSAKFQQYLFQNFGRENSGGDRIFLVYRNDSLLFWTQNTFTAPVILDTVLLNRGFVYYGNGYYSVNHRSSGKWTYIGIQLVKQHFRYRNNYLADKFSKGYPAPDETEIYFIPDRCNVTDEQGKFAFSLRFQKAPPLGQWMQLLLLGLFMAAFLFLISTLFSAYILVTREFIRRSLMMLAFAADVIILRGIQFYFKFPSVLYDSDIFSPVYFASSFLLPSLGDLIINTLLLLQVSWLVYTHAPVRKGNLAGKSIQGMFSAAGVILLVIAVYWGLCSLLSMIVMDSNLPLRFDMVLDFSILSVYGLLAIGTLMLIFVFLFETAMRFLFRMEPNPWKILAYWSVIIGILFTLDLFYGGRYAEYLFILFLLVLIRVLMSLRSGQGGIETGQLLISLLITAALVTHILARESTKRELEHRSLIANHLSEARDILAEYYYRNAAEKMVNDTKLIGMLNSISDTSSTQHIEKYLDNRYFSGFWNKYSVQYTICSPGEKLIVKPGNFVTDCESYFTNQVATLLEPVPVRDLYFLKTSVDESYYLGKVEFNPSDVPLHKPVTIYIELSSNRFAGGAGYPELLVDKSLPSSENISAYSYSYYINNELVKSVGKYYYETRNEFGTATPAGKEITRNGYSHLVRQVNDQTILVISLEKPGFSEVVSPFSFVFIFTALMLVFILVITGKMFRIRFIMSSFRVRMQVFIVLIILVSTLLIGIVTLIFINQQNLRKNRSHLGEKMNSVLVELEFRLGNKASLNASDLAELNDDILSLANSNFTDINIYDPRGYLLASSRSQIFDEKLIAGLISAEGYHNLHALSKSFYMHYEQVGNYRYLSAYAPLRNFNNKLLGYLNLPYFSRQEELRTEVSSLLATFANIYIILAVLAVIVALLLSRYITKPLQVIRNQIFKLKLGSENAKVEWERNDEIGSLVTEYNRMVDELAKSAEILAKSERESAWRQMARQVAHEVKNPLTPIKLSMQHLLKAWDDKAPDWDTRLKRFSETLIMQIDTLSDIAAEFSDFAQMPEPVNVRFDILKVLNHAARLFRDTSAVSIRLESTEEQCYILADEKQMLRVFNNLIKNAIQAVPQERHGRVEIRLMKENGYCTITFSDNGSGIPSEQQARIFSPNFTTKSAGMGLGLAMVKNIIDQAGGRISFKSVPGEGTTFTINLPSGGRLPGSDAANA